MTVDLWVQLKKVLAANGMLPPGNPTPAEIARHADQLAGNRNVGHFVNDFHYPRLFNGGRGKLSDTQAEDLVAAIERSLTERSYTRAWPDGVAAAISEREFSSIRSAIDAAQPGDQILLRPGVHKESLVIDKPVTLVGLGARGEAILHSEDKTTVELAASDVVLRRLAVRMICTVAGDSAPPAVIFSRGRATMEECDISGGKTGDGLRIKIGTDPMVRRCRVTDCGGLGIWVQRGGAGTFEDCEIRNTGLSGVNASGSSRFVRSVIAKSAMSGLDVADGASTFEACEIRESSKRGLVVRASANPTLRSCKISGNLNTGVLIYDKGMGLFENCEIYKNGIDSTGSYCGVIAQDHSTPTFRKTTIRANGHHGLLVNDEGNALVEDCRIFDNGTSGICVDKGCDPIIRRSNIYGNSADGICVLEGGRGVIEGCTIENNGGQNIKIEKNANPVLR